MLGHRPIVGLRMIFRPPSDTQLVLEFEFAPEGGSRDFTPEEGAIVVQDVRRL